MKLLDLPLEVFRAILEEIVVTVGRSRAPRLRLVNRLFNNEVIRAVCRTDILLTYQLKGSWGVYYIQNKVLERSTHNSNCNYLFETVRWVVDELVKEYQGCGQHQKKIEVSFVLSKLVEEHMPFFSTYILEVQEVRSPDPSSAQYMLEKRKHEFTLSNSLGKGQRSHAPEHLLSAAAYVGNVFIVENLLDLGVNVNLGSNVFGKPLSAAARGGHIDIVRLLLANGADASDGVHPRTEEDERLLLSKYQKDQLENDIARNGSIVYTALGAAAMGGHEQAVWLLLQPKYGVSKATYSYRAAIMNASRGGNANLMRFLMEAGEFSSVSETDLRKLWKEALCYASMNGRADVVCLLLDHGVPVDVEDAFWDHVTTPLGLAAVFGHLDVAQLLLRRGAAVDSTLRCKRTPIMEAAARGYLRIIELLLNHGADVHQGELPHPLESAAYSGQAAAVQFLLEKEAHLGMRYKGSLAFDGALYEGYESVVTILRDHGFHSMESDSDA